MNATTREPTVLQPTSIARSREWHDAARKARRLSWLSLAWMGAEGVITAGIAAGSIALVSFGLDLHRGLRQLYVIVWRFTGSRLHLHAAETRAQKLVAVQFLPPRPLRRLRGDPPARHRRAPGDELARHRPRHVVGDRDAVPRHRQAPARRPARLRRHPRGGTQNPLRLPRARRPRRPRRQRALRPLVARPRRRADRRGRRRSRGRRELAGRGCCATCWGPVARTLDPEGAHLASLRRLADFRGQRVLEMAAAKGGSPGRNRRRGRVRPRLRPGRRASVRTARACSCPSSPTASSSASPRRRRSRSRPTLSTSSSSPGRSGCVPPRTS